MRLLAIGDIHGCFTALSTLEQFVPFTADDLLVTLGDYVNRGPDSRAVLDWLIAREATGKLIALRGNHEIMMLRARDTEQDFRTFLEVGGLATLASYASPEDDDAFSAVPAEHWAFLERTRPYYETDSHIFVHANLYPDAELEDQPDFMLYWEKFDAQQGPHESGKIMVCGHTPQRSGVPLNLGHAVCIDTKAHGGLWLTCLDVASGRYWQANQQGETRSDWLEEC
jgi:serine/threonine protein phosphatase 1